MLSELAAAVRDKKVSARELVEEALHRIAAGNGSLNAVVRLRADEARAEADALDESRRTGPLAGLPLLVKDLQDVAGLPTTFGTPLFSDGAPAAVDATIVARFRAAGAIVVGKTNTPAFGWNAFTDNKVFGASRNPWNPAAFTPVVRVEVRRPHSRPGSHPSRRRPTVVGRCASRPRCAGWSGTSRRSARSDATAHRGGSRSRRPARPARPSPTSCSRRRFSPGRPAPTSTSSRPDRSRSRRSARRTSSRAERCDAMSTGSRGRVHRDRRCGRTRPRVARDARRSRLRHGGSPAAVVRDRARPSLPNRSHGPSRAGTSSSRG